MPFVPPSDERIQETLVLEASAGAVSGFTENVVKEGSYAWATRALNSEYTLKTIALEKEQSRYNRLIDEGVIDGEKMENPGFTGRTDSDEGGIISSVRDIYGGGFGNEIAGFATNFIPGQLGLRDIDRRGLENFTRKLREANEQLPSEEKFRMTKPEDLEKRVQRHLDEQREDIEEFRARSKTALGTVGSFAGPILTETVADPVDVASLAFGAQAGSGIMKTAGYEAMVGGLTEAAQQPFVQEYRKKYGMKYGAKQALSNILMVAVGSGGLGGGLKALGKGGDAVARRLGLRTKGYKRAGKLIGENIEKFPKGVRDSIREGTVTRNDLAEILKFEQSKGRLTPQQEAVLKIHEANKVLSRSNPYDNESVPKVDRGKIEHLENIQEATRAMNERRIPDIDPDENPEPLRMDRVETKETKVNPDDIDFEEQPLPTETERMLEGADLGEDVGVSPVLYRKPDGTHAVMRGREQIATGRPGDDIDAVVIDGRNNDLNDARAWVMGREAEIRGMTKSDVAEATGRSEESIPDMSQSQFTRDVKDMLKLDDEAFRAMIANKVPTNLARKITDTIDDAEQQARAMRVLSDAEDINQAEQIIERGAKNGFSEEEASDVINRMNKIRETAIEDLRRGGRKITVNGDDLNVDGGFVKGLRQLSESRTPVGRVLRAAERQARESGSTRSGVDTFTSRLTEEFEQGNISRADVREAGAFKRGREEVQQILTRDPEEAQRIIEGTERGDAEQLDELEETVRSRLDEEEKVKFEDVDRDGNTVEREMTFAERMDEFDRHQEQTNALRECLT